ncbi:MAG: dihydrofolate reductase [Devosia sp.]
MSIDIIGHAIVSADGMIASADGTVPPALRNDIDWLRFQAALDRAALVVIGRIAHRRFPNPGRKRLVATRSVTALEPDPRDPRASFWNPAGIGFPEAVERLGVTSGTIAVTGLFDLILPHFTGFDLAEAHSVTLPGGMACFVSGPPAEVLTAAGLQPGTAQVLDPVANVTLTRWRKP